MMVVTDKDTGSHVFGERDADQQLLIAAKCSMSEKLGIYREKGFGGWWDKSTCSIKYLYSLRDKALKDNDHVSVMNYSAMIAMRESVE